MIPSAHIAAWRTHHPWPSPDQVEQDLLLSWAICAIAEHPYLRDELVFRGGTALHKLHLPRPCRYSEDLDYVRSTASGIGPVFDALKDIGRELGFKVQSIVQEHPKVLWRTESEHGDRLRLKIELNTHERSPALPLLRLPFKVESSWWSGSANVLTFQPSELMATKLRALYQRSKGRDLFDLWLALTATGLDPQAVLRAFGPYRPVGYTAKSAIANLEEKLTNKTFRTDIDLLLAERPVNYNPDDAAALVIEVLLSKVL